MQRCPLVDSHCHLDFYPADDRSEVVRRAVEAGVPEMVTIGTRLSQAGAITAMAREGAPEARIWCPVGTHPAHVGDDLPASAASIARLAEAAEVIGIGESGLDHVVEHADRTLQEASFRLHIAAARLAAVPLVIHARAADAEIIRILRKEQDQGAFDFVLHCFSAGRELATSGIELGGYVSFSGILTFSKATGLREIARSLPRERLLLETDAPFLAPVPKRGRRNEPAFLVHTAALLADLLDCSSEQIGQLTSDNFRRLFRKAA